MGETTSEVHVAVSGPVGIGKSAIAGEIEIAMKAIGVPVRHVDERAARAEKNATHADWASEIERLKPTVAIEEVPISSSAMEHVYGLLWGVTTDDERIHEARRIARSRITEEGRLRGIEWAGKHAGPPESGYAAVRRGL